MTRRYWLSIGFAALLIGVFAYVFPALRAPDEQRAWDRMRDCINAAMREHPVTSLAYEEAERKCRNDYYGANR